MKKTICLTLVSFFVLGAVSFSWAKGKKCGLKTQPLQAQAATEEQKAVEVGNKICPVSGEKIEEKTKATYEYKGKIYNFCCTMCIDEFKKDPGKYIKKVEEELKAQSKEETQEKIEQPSTMHEESGHMHH